MMKATKTIAMLLAVGMFAAFVLAFGTTANADVVYNFYAGNDGAFDGTSAMAPDASTVKKWNTHTKYGAPNPWPDESGDLLNSDGVDDGVDWFMDSQGQKAVNGTRGGGIPLLTRYLVGQPGSTVYPTFVMPITGLDDGYTYDLYGYSNNNWGSYDTRFEVTTGTLSGVREAYINSTSNSATYVLADAANDATNPGENYFVFEDITPVSGEIAFQWGCAPGTNRPVFSGFQLHGTPVPEPPSSGGPLVYESMSHSVGAGNLHGNTADKGLGAWNVSPNGSGQIVSPGMSYTDGNGNVLPTTGNRYETVVRFNDLARASIDTIAWSADNKDGGKLNAEGAEIWFSALMNATTAGGGLAYNHFHLDFTDTDNGNASWANGPGFFAVGKDTGSGVWEIRADNDDGDADVQAYSTVDCGTDTFILGRFLTDATTGETVFDAWFNPLLDTAPGAAGTGDVSITLAANDDGSVTQFDTLGYRHQKWESPNLLDEIRMGETFNSVVGRAGATGDDIPEPATMALLGLAACGLGGYVRRRRKA